MYSTLCQRHIVMPRTVVKPVPIVSRRHVRQVNHRPKFIISDIEFTTYIVGKGIILFTMFYCGLNWLHYRELNKDNKQKKDEDDYE